MKLILVAAAAAIAGDAGGYWLGRSFGRALLSHYGRYLRLSEEKLQRFESFFPSRLHHDLVYLLF